MCYINQIKNKLIALFSMFKSITIKGLFAILKFVSVVFIIGLFLFLSVCLSKYCNIQNPTEVESQEIYICGISLANWCTWITLFGLIVTALWSIHQYNKNKLSKQQEKASEIAKDFSNKLIEKMGLISDTLMSNPKINKLIKELDTSKLSEFTIIEMVNIYKDTNLTQLYFDILNSKNTQKKYNQILNQRYDQKEKGRFSSKFTILVDTTLNELEAICVSISSKAAGSQFIYDSLHQIFLSTIEILSIRISATNSNNVDKYYTNIISVYNMWNVQKNKDIKKLNKTNKKISKLENRADREIKKLLSKQTKTV